MKIRMFRIISVLLMVFAIFSSYAYSKDISLKDDTGRVIKLDSYAKRIIPLYGAFLEMLFAVGAGRAVIARTKADSYFEPAKSLPSVGTHMRPNVEMIISMKPDLVIQTVSQKRRLPEMARIEEAGIPVAAFSPKDFESIFHTMLIFGKITGHEENARNVVDKLRSRLKKLRNFVKQAGKRYTVFFEVRQTPLTAAGRSSIVQKILDAAGLENIVTVNRKLVQFDVETLLARNPDFYIIQKGPMNRNPVPLHDRSHLSRLKAARSNRVLMVDEFMFSRPGPRCVDAVEYLIRKIYGHVPEG